MKYFLISVLFAALSTAAQPLTVLPFRLENNAILFRCSVNGSDSLTFLFDTGANTMVLNESASAKFTVTATGETLNTGSNGSNTVQVSGHNAFRFGDIAETDVAFTLIPYGDAGFDGVFGSNLMRNYVIEIDYSRKELRFFSPETYSTASLKEYEKLRVTDVNGYPAIRSSFRANGKTCKGLFGLDTGADNSLTIASPYVRDHALNTGMRTIATASSIGSDGVEYASPIVVVPQLYIGTKVFYELPVYLSASTEGIDATTEMAGFYGNAFLKRFQTVLDLSGNAIWLKPNHLVHTPYFDFLTE